MKNIEMAVKRAKKRGQEAETRSTEERVREPEKRTPATRRDTAIGDIEYQQTRTLHISSEQLAANRVVAHLEQDPRAVPFDMLRTKVLKRMRDKGWRTLAICSATPGAGKSLVASNLAVSMAREGNHTVLLVDLDLKNPSIHKYFSIKPEQGIEAHLEDATPLSDLLVNPGLERLTILPGKNKIAHSSQLLSSKAFASLLEELRSRYESRLILFDLPPLLVSDDAFIFTDQVDASLLIIEEGKNTEEEIQNSLNLLQSTDMLGSVLNKSETNTSAYYYGSV